jgi:hypothetical protein
MCRPNIFVALSPTFAICAREGRSPSAHQVALEARFARLIADFKAKATAAAARPQFANMILSMAA